MLAAALGMLWERAQEQMESSPFQARLSCIQEVVWGAQGTDSAFSLGWSYGWVAEQIVGRCATCSGRHWAALGSLPAWPLHWTLKWFSTTCARGKSMSANELCAWRWECSFNVEVCTLRCTDLLGQLMCFWTCTSPVFRQTFHADL